MKQKGGKEVFAWAVEADVDAGHIISNTFNMEWPPHSGHTQNFPEVDRAGWFAISEANVRMNQAQVIFLERLQQLIDSSD